jgi:hypothetical protein
LRACARLTLTFVFNGVQLRIADGLRPLANRWVDFDLDTVADDPRTFVALWTTARGSLSSKARDSWPG